MSKFIIREAGIQLSRLIQKALAGEEVIITKAGKPVVRLVPIDQKRVQRQLGGWKGTFWMAADFDQTPEGFEEYPP